MEIFIRIIIGLLSTALVGYGVIEITKAQNITVMFMSVMLVCFGLSWPISVVKNIKSKTAKNMSLRFILLIVVGYIAGISAKIILGSFNYVLVVYVLNLAIVSINIPVYFINKKYDKKLALYKKEAA